MITKLKTRYTDFYVHVVYKVQYCSISEIVDCIKELECDMYRLCIDQNGCEAIILPSIEHKELSEQLIQDLVIEEGHCIAKQFTLTVIGKQV